MVFLVTLWVWLLGTSQEYLATSRTWEKDASEDIEPTLIGVKAEKIGMISLTDKSTFLSILVKIRYITEASLPTRSGHTIITRCKILNKTPSEIYKLQGGR